MAEALLIAGAITFATGCIQITICICTLALLSPLERILKTLEASTSVAEQINNSVVKVCQSTRPFKCRYRG